MWEIDTSHGVFEYETIRQAVNELSEFHLERFDDYPSVKSIRGFCLSHNRDRMMLKSTCEALQEKISAHIQTRFREEKDEDSNLYREWVGMPARYDYKINPEYR